MAANRKSIHFTGLRFVKKIATGKKILEEIKGFFVRRGLEIPSVQVHFVHTKQPGLPVSHGRSRNPKVSGDYLPPDHIRMALGNIHIKRDVW